LQRAKQHRSGILQPPGKKVADSDPHHSPVVAIAGVEPESGFQMLDREIGLSGP